MTKGRVVLLFSGGNTNDGTPTSTAAAVILHELQHHSVLSKARRRWGAEVFKRLFERMVRQCVEAGLVDGKKIFMDSSLIEANASNNSIMDRQSLDRYLRKGYEEFEQRLEKEEREKDSDDNDKGKGQANRRHVSMTDLDAAVIRQRGDIKSKPRYKTHRAVDGSHEVITATEITSGGVDEAHRLIPLVENHRKNTGCRLQDNLAQLLRHFWISTF